MRCTTRGMLARLAFLVAASAYVIYPWLCRRTASRDERERRLPGDERILHASTGYTLAVDVDAPADDVWRWLVRIDPELVRLDVGDVVRPRPGPALVVSRVDPGRVLVLEETLKTGGSGTRAFVLHDRRDGTSRLLFRRRADRPSLLDRLAMPGYLFMDRGMLEGIRRRAERKERPALAGHPIA